LSDEGDGFDVRSLGATFRTGALVGWHQHRWGQLVFASSGLMRVRTEAAVWLIPPTRAVWLPAATRHRIAISGEVALRTLYIARVRAVVLPDAPTVLEVAPLLRELILHILRLGMLDPGRPEHDRIAGLLIDLLHEARPQDLALPLPRDPRALRLAEHIQRDPGNGDELGTLSTVTGASLRTLQRIYPRETGLTVEAWRQKARLLHAIDRLSAGATVTDAGLDCGYQSMSAFIAAFARQFGVTPSRYIAR
jgi:AraC-like DNA-binding protein